MHNNIAEILKSIPVGLIDFLLVTIFSLIIGLSQRRLHQDTDEFRLFGTDRTFTFIGILGYILLIVDLSYKRLFICGGVALMTFLAINYFYKIKNFSDFGLTTILIALLTYCIPLILLTQPFWFLCLLLVTILIFTELKDIFSSVSARFDRYEFITLSKFIIMAGLILPTLPDEPISPSLSISPFKLWLAVVAISSISYISYLLKKFVFKDAGIVLSGILGGFYSSTATTLVLARKLKEDVDNKNQYFAAIILATAMMYFRVLILVFIFNKTLFTYTLPAFLALIALSTGIALFVLYYKKKTAVNNLSFTGTDRNPLEFKVAIIFTVLFVFISFLTQYALSAYGNAGVSIFSFIVGIIDIDPFLLSMFQGKLSLSLNFIAIVSFQAIVSNNIAKMVYACFLAGQKNWKMLIFVFGGVILGNFFIIALFRF